MVFLFFVFFRFELKHPFFPQVKMMFSSALVRISFRMLLMATMHVSLLTDRQVMLNTVDVQNQIPFNERENRTTFTE